jgi:hypothetical protein
MNFKIKANSTSVSIDGVEVTTTPIFLVNVTFGSEADKTLFSNSVRNGDLIVLTNDIPSENGEEVASKYIQMQSEVDSTQSMLIFDMAEQERYLDILEIDATTALIDLSYSPREVVGKIYARKRTSMLVFDIVGGTMTDEEAFIIEEKTERAFNKVSKGHFKSAYKYIDKATVEGKFDQTFKDSLLTEIQVLIDNHY